MSEWKDNLTRFRVAIDTGHLDYHLGLWALRQIEMRGAAAPLMTSDDAARWLGIAPKTLLNWRGANFGPTYITVNKEIRYAYGDLEAWVSANKNKPSNRTKTATPRKNAA